MNEAEQQDLHTRSAIGRGLTVFSPGRPFLALAIGLFAVAFAIVMLTVASAHPGIVFGPDPATQLLAFEMVAVTMLLALVSVGDRIRLTLQMILIYLAIYLILPGYHHSSANSFPFYSMQYPQEVRFTAAAIISLFLISLVAGYLVSERMDTGRLARKTLGNEILFPNQVLLIVLVVLSYAATAVYLATVGLDVAFSARVEFVLTGASAAELGVFVALPRIATFVAFAYAYVLYLRSQKKALSLFFIVLSSIPFFITNFPPVLARFALFGIILFFFVQTFDLRAARARLALTLTFLFGALFAMPYVDTLNRRIGEEASTTIQGAYDAYLASGDFDGLQSIQNVVIYVDKEGFGNGIQLLSAVLFFVPRAIWSDKSEATGQLTSRAAGYQFNNISQPLPSEFYVDFGMSGVVAASLMLGFAIARFDGWIDRNWHNGPRARLIAGVVVAYAIIVMRGSLLGIISPVLTFAAGIYFIIRFGLGRPESLLLRRRSRLSEEGEPSPRVARHARTVASRR